MAQFSSKVQHIGVYTSGGDAPGMNAALRAVVRTAISKGLQISGIPQGYIGFLEGSLEPLDLRSVANIIQRGGTILRTGRCPEFHKAEARTRSAENLKKQGIDALICIGGDGSFEGAHLLWKEHGVPIVGVPGTIDNDIFGTDSTIGFDTAVNTALEAIDRIRDTAASHDRLFIVEVMGRNSGFIAADVGVAGGAEEIFVPDHTLSVDEAVEHIKEGMAKGKKSSILVAAEGQKPGRAYDLAESIRKKTGFDAKVCILGHIQRGGSPTAADRILASRLGFASVEALLDGQCDIMVGIQGDTVLRTPFKEAVATTKTTPRELIDLARILSR